MNSVISRQILVTKSFLPVLKKLLLSQKGDKTNETIKYGHGRLRRIHNKPLIGNVLNREVLKISLCCKEGSFWKSLSSNSEIKAERSEFHQKTLSGLRIAKDKLKLRPKCRTRTRDAESKSKCQAYESKVQYYEFSPRMSLKNIINTRNSAHLPPGLIDQKDLKEIQEQHYSTQSVQNLGPDLAAVHFFTDRRAAVRLVGFNDWIVGGAPNITNNTLLRHCLLGGSSDEECYISRCHVEAVDCSNFKENGIRYEGLKYLTGLKYLKFLSLKNQKHVDVWCLDRIASLNGYTLQYLDITKCNLDFGCICALSRMPSLKMLVIKHPGRNIEVNKELGRLQENNPNLTIRTINSFEGIQY